MAELAEMDVHVDNEGECPVFSLGVKETACDSSVFCACFWSKISETAGGGGADDVDHRRGRPFVVQPA